jgi:hypothetical protein
LSPARRARQVGADQARFTRLAETAGPRVLADLAHRQRTQPAAHVRLLTVVEDHGRGVRALGDTGPDIISGDEERA